MDTDKVASQSASSNLLYWTLGLMAMPIALPLAFINVLHRYRSKRFSSQLPGKVVLITGASSGLGESLAHVFYKAGCKVILAARRVEELERVKNDLMKIETNSIVYPPTVVPLDLAELNGIPTFVTKALSVYNQIDIVINNGGISVRANIMSTAVDVDLKVMLVNYFGAVALTKAVLPSMVKRQCGHIVFIGSVQGKIALPYRSSYSASKHAMQGFADSLRAEVRGDGVNVTFISPGYIRTQLSMNALTGNGQAYGKMDKTTESGMSPEKLARRIFNAVLCNEDEVIECDLSAKVACYIRTLCPPLYFWIMEKRAAKLRREEEREAGDSKRAS